MVQAFFGRELISKDLHCDALQDMKYFVTYLAINFLWISRDLASLELEALYQKVWLRNRDPKALLRMELSFRGLLLDFRSY